MRLATPADEPFIIGLSPRFAESELPPWRTRDEIAQGTAAQLRAAIARGNTNDSAILIAMEDHKPAGFAWVLMIADFYGGPPTAKISEIAAVQSGNGIGQALMAAAETWARERGAQLMQLNALEGNTYARRFYEKQGYAPEYTALVKRL